jgi:hypothetical protein
LIYVITSTSIFGQETFFPLKDKIIKSKKYINHIDDFADMDDSASVEISLDVFNRLIKDTAYYFKDGEKKYMETGRPTSVIYDINKDFPHFNNLVAIKIIGYMEQGDVLLFFVCIDYGKNDRGGWDRKEILGFTMLKSECKIKSRFNATNQGVGDVSFGGSIDRINGIICMLSFMVEEFYDYSSYYRVRNDGYFELYKYKKIDLGMP